MTSRPGPLGQLLATELRAEMGRQNRSRRWLAEQVHAPHNTVSRWIAGETSPPIDALDDMCQALGIETAGLIAAAKFRLGAAGGRTQNGGVMVERRRNTETAGQRQWRRWTDLLNSGGINVAATGVATGML